MHIATTDPIDIDGHRYWFVNGRLRPYIAGGDGPDDDAGKGGGAGEDDAEKGKGGAGGAGGDDAEKGKGGGTGDDDEDGAFDADRARAKINRTNAEAAALRQRLKDAEAKVAEFEDKNKTESERQTEAKAKAERERDDAATALLRLEVILDKADGKQLTMAQARKLSKRLQGATREELEADADELLEDYPDAKTKSKSVDGRPRPKRGSGGLDPDEEPDERDPAKLAAAIPRR